MIEDYGTNNIYAFHLTTGPRTKHDRSERRRKPLTFDDAEAIKAQASAVEDVGVEAPNVGYSGGPFDDTSLIGGNNYRWGNTTGVTANYADLTNVTIAKGVITDVTMSAPECPGDRRQRCGRHCSGEPNIAGRKFGWVVKI